MAWRLNIPTKRKCNFFKPREEVTSDVGTLPVTVLKTDEYVTTFLKKVTPLLATRYY